MNVVKERGRSRGRTQHYMLKADPTLLRSCWDGRRRGKVEKRGERGSKGRNRREDAAQEEKNGLRKFQT